MYITIVMKVMKMNYLHHLDFQKKKILTTLQPIQETQCSPGSAQAGSYVQASFQNELRTPPSFLKKKIFNQPFQESQCSSGPAQASSYAQAGSQNEGSFTKCSCEKHKSKLDKKKWSKVCN